MIKPFEYERYININTVFPNNKTLLYMACEENDYEKAYYLIENGANCNGVWSNGKLSTVPIIISSVRNYTNILTLLLSFTKQINIYVSMDTGDTILHILAKNGNSEIIHKLLAMDEGCMILRVNKKNETPLHVAVKQNHYNVVQQLLQHYDIHLLQIILQIVDNDGLSIYKIIVLNQYDTLFTIFISYFNNYSLSKENLYTVSEQINSQSIITNYLRNLRN